MLTLPGYQVSEQIFQSRRSRIFRGIRTADHQPVILKLCADDYPDQAVIHRLRHEYQIGHSLNDPHLTRYLALEPYQHALALVEEDAGMISLAGWLPKAGLELNDFLPIAVQLVEAVAVLHDHHIIHKDICPNNIIIHPDTRQIKLIDFSIASQLGRETQSPLATSLLEGTLTHISPEQTGRMNRAVDYRTDFYALGVTFYQLLTGQLPFDVSDELELIHCHLSKQPVPPHEVTPPIPPVLSQLIMKLLEKNAEDRYQSARGLKTDLAWCLHELETYGKLVPFELGQQDFAPTLQPSQKLYGRDREIQTLLEAFDRVAQGNSELLLVAGYSGIGKTALVQEVHKPIVAKRGWFAAGKFDQFQRNTPYFAWLKALEELLKQLLTEPEPKLNVWQAKLQQALGVNAQVLIEVLPSLELIIGPQPAVAKLGPAESERRFHQVFKQLINTLARPEHPLVLFLDDLQWADAGSLNLLEILMSESEHPYLLCLGAYRDNEVDAGHPLLLTLERIREAEALVHTLILSPLKQADLDQLLADTLQSSTTKVAGLSTLVMQKTAGNPFFANEFLKMLEQEQLLRFDPEQKTWVWDVAEIEQQNITDNVVSLMVAKIRQQPPATQEALKLAACIGNHFELETLSLIHKRSMAQTAQDLWLAVRAGMIAPLERMNPIVQMDNGRYQVPSGTPVLNTLYKFLHDRVQQAAHEEIPAARRPAIHLKIGRLLFKNTAPQELDEHLFTITEQLNAGRELIESEEERLRLARLNLQTGEKAKAASAYGAAARYFAIGHDLLPDQAWQKHYHLWLPLILQQAETEYLSGHFDRAEQLYRDIVPHAQSTLDKIQVFEVQMAQYHVQGRYAEALRIQQEGLALLGWPLPDAEEALQPLLEQELQTIQSHLAQHQIEDLVDAPKMHDPEKLIMMRLLMNVFYSAYLLGKSTLLDLGKVKMASLSLCEGHSELSPLAYAHYGSFVSNTLHDHATGTRFGQLALKLTEQFDNPLIKGRTYHVFAALICPWTQHLSLSQQYSEAAYEEGMKTGDWVTLGYVILIMQTYKLARGDNLTQLAQETQGYLSQLKQMKNTSVSDNLLARVVQPIRQLQGLTDSRISLDDALFSEEHYLQIYAAKPAQLASLSISRIRTAYLFEDRDHWLDLAEQADWMEAMLPGLYLAAEAPFYAALIWLEMAADKSQSTHARERAETIVTKMKRWTDQCPDNFLHKLRLLQAEQDRLADRLQQAMDHYEQAIAAAKQYGFTQIEALACERYGRFWLHQERDEFARLYLQKAHRLYRQWGAQAKVDMLEEMFPQHALPEESSETTSTLIRSSQSTQSRTLDWLSLMKATQVIAGKVTLADLLPTLMKLMVENAGAERGAMLLQDRQTLMIEALYPESHEPDTLPQALEQSDLLCEAVIRYVARTRQPLILNHVADHTLFASDAYVKRHKPRSMLCIPLQEQRELIGLLYLEHRMLANAFTSERVELLKILSAQATIALKNARLYDHLSRSETRLRNLIEGSIQGILVHRDYQPLFANQTLAAMLGFHSPEEILALESLEPLLTDNAKERLRHHQAAHARGEPVPQEYELEVLHQNGQLRILQFLDREVLWDDQQAVQSTLMDITERKAAERQVQHLASHDGLTDLPNRTLFQDRLQQALAETQREHAKVAVLLLDLDNFQGVNDSLGQAMGDTLLKTVARRLLENVHSTDTVARLGGDEFAVLLPHLHQASDADMMALRLRQALAEPFQIDGQPVEISASLGISLYPDDSEQHEELIRDADLALYKAKRQGRNTYRFYQEGMNLQLRQHKSLAEQLRHALAYDRLVLHYRPRVDQHHEQVAGLEATIRWPQPGRPDISPAQFLPIAEHMGLGVQLGEWLLQSACRQLRHWRQGALAELTLAVNLLPSYCLQPDLFERLRELLADYDIEPARLELGINESVLLQDVEIIIDTLSRLAGMGVRFTLDDFGAKYSSLGYLKRLPVSAIKLDRTFVLELVEPDTQALVQGLIDLAHRLRLSVIADGVDDEEQMKFLKRAGCDQVQGRFYSRALSPEAFEQWFKDYALGLR